MNNKYSQKLLDSVKKCATDPIQTAAKRAIKKTADATGDLISNRIADKIANFSKKSSRELHTQNDEANNEIEVPKERYISSEKRQQIIDELRLVQ